jgi:peptidoglycan/xylan/chitin deacetylase (PgdA/CDA1 family)
MRLFCVDSAGALLHWSGLERVYEAAARPNGAIILMYHSVASDDAAKFVEDRIRMSPETFERQMRFLAAHRRVEPLSRVVDDIAVGTSPAAGTVCITFDDGYLDNLTVAAPILERYRLPATLYLATGYIERAETQWADVLHWLFGSRTRDRLALSAIGLEAADLQSAAGRNAALAVLHSYLLGSTRDERTQVLGDVECQLAPAGKPPRLTLDWDDVRELRRRYPTIEIGGHTRDHVDLRKYGGAVAKAQIAGCAEDLRRELGAEPRHFSFPYERWDAGARDAVVATGWRSGVGAGTRLRIDAGSDRYTMPRVEAPKTMSGLGFKTSGAYPGALSMLKLM